MSVRKRVIVVLVAAAVVFTASGCVEGTPSPGPSPSLTSAPSPGPPPTTSSSPTPDATSTPPASAPPTSTPPASTPTASAQAYDPADLATWVISYSGIGPVLLDRPLADVRAEVTESEEGCQPAVALFFDRAVVGVGTGSATGLITVASTGSNTEVDVEPRPHTDAGITTGSTFGQLLTAYPAAEAYSDSNGRPGYRLTDGTSWIHFTSLDGQSISGIDVSRNLTDLKEYCG